MGFRPNLPLPVGDVISVAPVSEPNPADASEYIKELRNLCDAVLGRMHR